jgi:threonine dehydratase
VLGSTSPTIESDPTSFYVDVHTEDFAPGAVRGQFADPFTVTSRFTVEADAAQVVDGGEPGATGTWQLRVDRDLDLICYAIELDGVSGAYQSPALTATHVHEGDPGEAGPARVAFADPQPVDPEAPDGIRRSSGCVEAGAAAFPEGAMEPDPGAGFSVAALEDDPTAYYVDTHTEDFPAGAVRGQFGPASPIELPPILAPLPLDGVGCSGRWHRGGDHLAGRVHGHVGTGGHAGQRVRLPLRADLIRAPRSGHHAPHITGRPRPQLRSGHHPSGGSVREVEPLGPDAVAAAVVRIAGRVRRTPLLQLEAGALGLPGRLALKLDLLQPTGSFKVRGATNLLAGSEVPDAGVVAASGGNFGAAVAWAARLLGHRATIVIPGSSPASKRELFAELGAELEVVPGVYADALTRAEELVTTTGALRAHAYDDPLVVAGQGTAAVEVLEDLPDVDTVVVAVGGGGLLAGTCAALAGRGVRVVAVETDGCPTLRAALDAGGPVDTEVGGLAVSALGARRLGEHAWAARQAIDLAVTVPDAAVAEAQDRLWGACRLRAEPAGAAALAALVAGAYLPAADERVALWVCGAN